MSRSPAIHEDTQVSSEVFIYAEKPLLAKDIASLFKAERSPPCTNQRAIERRVTFLEGLTFWRRKVRCKTMIIEVTQPTSVKHHLLTLTTVGQPYSSMGPPRMYSLTIVSSFYKALEMFLLFIQMIRNSGTKANKL